MHLKYRNVNEAFHEIVYRIHMGTLPLETSPSRAGEIIRITEPTVITYNRPCERVLFNEARDCNPFFHLYESLWMLAGRNDVAPLEYYNSKMRDFSDDGSTFNGAYGYRWRWAYSSGAGCVDQLSVLIEHLKENPHSRRAVLSMWNVKDDLLKIDTSKDVCCNLSVKFSVESGTRSNGSEMPHDQPRYLNMTVFNRSNDLIWGTLGANVVHFSMLQEYAAARLGLEVGVYNQISDDSHVYTDKWLPERWLRAGNSQDLYGGIEPHSLVRDPSRFDDELSGFMERHERDSPRGEYKEPFLSRVAQPMMMAFHHHKRRQYDEAEMLMQKVQADDWRIAGTSWIRKRRTNYERKTQAGTY